MSHGKYSTVCGRWGLRSQVNLGFTPESQLSNLSRDDRVKWVTISSTGLCSREEPLVSGFWGKICEFSGGKGEQGLNPVLPFTFFHVQCRQLSLEGLRFVVLTSGPSSHPLPRKHAHAVGSCWTTQQTGAVNAKYHLTFSCCALTGLVSLFFPACFCLETDSCISLVQQGKFLAAKMDLAIQSAGQQPLASFQAQDLSV